MNCKVLEITLKWRCEGDRKESLYPVVQQCLLYGSIFLKNIELTLVLAKVLKSKQSLEGIKNEINVSNLVLVGQI